MHIRLGKAVLFLLGSISVQGQSPWIEHGSVEQWFRAGNRWQLNASEPGLASIILLPAEAMNESTGCTFRVRWRQEFSGSNANFTRLHWLFDSTAWIEPLTPSIPAAGWSVLEEHGALSFMHLGETGANDSIRWFRPSANGYWDAVVSSIQHAHLPDAMDIELVWAQQPGSDSVRIALAHVAADGSRPAIEFAAHATHGVPVGIGFSVQFTASNTDAASFEILEYGPYAPDTVAPTLLGARWKPNSGLRLAFSEPMNSETGLIHGGPEQDSIPLLWLHPPGRISLALPALSHMSSMPFRLTGFEDINGQPLLDTSLCVYPVLTHAGAGDVVITELMIESPSQGEWIELLNVSDRSVEISNIHLWDGSTNSSKSLMPLLGWDGVLGPNQRAVIANEWSPWMAEMDISFFAKIRPSITLANTGETIGLFFDGGAAVDEVSYQSEWWQSSETIGLQKKHPLGCALQQNWTAIDQEVDASPGVRSPMEWPMDTAVQLAVQSVLALSHGTGMFELNQPLHPGCTPAIKGGWAWRDAHQSDALFWRIDSLGERTTWNIAAAGAQGCFDATPAPLHGTVEVGKFPQSGDLIITEVAHDPKGASAAWGMFVELFNPSETHVIELAGCFLDGASLNAFPPLHPLNRICIPATLGKASGNIELQNHLGEVVDAVHYNRCWHPRRDQSEAGFSLVRLQPHKGRVHPGAWWAWTSSAEASTGCSPGQPDHAESGTPSPPASMPIACGEHNGTPFIAFTAPCELEPPWMPLDSMFHSGTVWTQPQGTMAPFDGFCPASDIELNPALVSLNEVRKWTTGGAEPFIELANPSSTWASTENLFWTTAHVPFPDDWEPIEAETIWFIPPHAVLAFAECPSRIALTTERVLPAELPSLWGSVELRLAESGTERDAFIFNSGMETPWHTERHSFEKTTWNVRRQEAQWTTAASARGHSAGSWNSWQLQPDGDLNADILHVIQSTGFASSTGEVVPIAFQVNAPNAEAWEVQWTIENNLGTVIAASEAMPAVVSSTQPTVCQWNGSAGKAYAAPGAYLLKVELHSLQTHQQLRAQAPVFICPN